MWLGGIFVLGLIVLVTYNSYDTYKDTIIKQQQEQLLTISKVVGRSLEIYFEEQITNISLVERSNSDIKTWILDPQSADEKAFEEQLKEYYKTWEFVAVYIIDEEGNICYKDDKAEGMYTQYSFDFSSVVEENTVGVGDVYEVEPHTLVLSIIQPITHEGKRIGSLIGLLDMEYIFNKIIRDTKVGEKGYVMVKDGHENIIMHPAKNQVGLDVIEGRRDQHPQLDYRDLENLMTLQYTQDEGAAEYYSYWWQEDVPTRVKKINSFSKIEVGKDVWVLAAVMDYSEMAEPINRNLLRLIQITGVIIIIIAIAVISVYTIQKRGQALILESNYLKNLNYTLSELQKTEKQMRHYEKLQSIETLTGGIAHEFNNLMTPILGYSQLALDTMEEDNAYHEDMEEIYTAAKKAKELVQQIMLFSRRDKTSMDYKVINLVEEVNAGLKMIKAGLNPQVQLQEIIENKEIYISGNATQVQQILINICNNAVQAMIGREGILTIRLYEVDEDVIEKINSKRLKKGKHICLSISDTGCGMPKDIKGRIFDPFFTTKTVGEGTGVGLSVVKGIVHNHKGDILVDSEEEVGSTFNIYLPICSCKKQEEEKQAEKRMKLDQKEITVLVVEDDVRVIKLVKKSLINMGYNVTAYTEAIKALEHFREKPDRYDLVITDYAMPKLTGTQLAESIKEIQPDIKVVIITGLIGEEVVKHIRNQVVDAFIMKPIEYQELDLKIKELVIKKV